MELVVEKSLAIGVTRPSVHGPTNLRAWRVRACIALRQKLLLLYALLPCLFLLRLIVLSSCLLSNRTQFLKRQRLPSHTRRILQPLG